MRGITMIELPKNVREFIVRDLIYIVGGGIVLTSFLYRFDRLPNRETPLAFYLLGAGMSYVVGSTIQDMFSIFRLVTTAHVDKMRQPFKWFYKLLTKEVWNDIEDFDPSKVRQAIRFLKNNDQAFASSYERNISLLILRATMAPCTMIASLIIWSQWYMCRNQFDFCLALITLFLSVVLFVLARLSSAKVTRIDSNALKEYCTKYEY